MATDLWEENVAWGGEGGHENDPKSNEKKGREQRANRKSVELRCFFPRQNSRKKTFSLLYSLQSLSVIQTMLFSFKSSSPLGKDEGLVLVAAALNVFM